MRRPRRIAVLKWTGLTLCVLIIAVWFVSRGRLASVFQSVGRFRAVIRSVGISGGCVYAYWINEKAGFRKPPEGWDVHAQFDRKGPRFVGWRWVPRISSSGAATEVEVPLYAPFLLLSLSTALLFSRDRRRVRWAREGRCLKCGYDLTALPAGSPCPECGS